MVNMAPRKVAFAEESAEVEVLYANLDRLKGLTKKIQASMGRLETSGKTVQESSGSAYGDTHKLQTTNSNIDRVIAAIDRMREPIDMHSREERIIKSAPQRAGLPEYMASLDRTKSALRDLKQTSLKANQQAISELSGLLRHGSQQLEDVFGNILRDGQQSIEPLHYITKAVEFPRLQPAKTAQLRSIHSYVASSMTEMSPVNGRPTTPTARLYANTRGDYLAISLQNLSTACIATAKKKDPDARYRRGDNAIGTYVTGLQGIYIAEYNSISQVFARDECGLVLSMTCQKSMLTFNNTLRELNHHIKDNMISDCFLAYEIIEVVSQCSTQFDVQTNASQVRDAMLDAVRSTRELAKGSMSAILVDVRSRTSAQQLIQLPPDGGSVPYTADVIARLQLLTDYMSPVMSILSALGDGGWSTPAIASSQSIPTLRSFEAGPDDRLLFTHYCLDVVETVLSCLQLRAFATLKTKSLQGVFLLNTVAVVERMINASELRRSLDGWQHKIDAWRKKATALYLDAWRDTSSFLLDVQYTNRGARPPSTSTGVATDSAAVVKALSSKDKDAIKEKFRSFNASFDDNVQKFKSYRLEREVSMHLAREIQMLIEALYGRFWDRYHEVDKGKGKYVRYDKPQLSALLARLA